MFFKLLSGELISIEFAEVVSAEEARKAISRYMGRPAMLLTAQEELENDEVVTIFVQDLPLVHKKFYIAGKLYRRVINDYSQEPEEWYNAWDGEEDHYTEEDTFSFVSDFLDFIPLSNEKMCLYDYMRIALVDSPPDELLPHFFGTEIDDLLTPIEWQLKLKKNIKHS